MNIRNNTRASDDFARAADDWVTLDDTARLLEETKTSVFSQRCQELGDMPVNKAEQIIKASKEWEDYLRKMVSARTQANRAKVRVEFMRMKFTEWNSDAANERHASRLGA